MTKAEILKKEILRQYRSVRQFAMEMNIPYSTLVTALERGIEGMAYGTADYTGFGIPMQYRRHFFKLRYMPFYRMRGIYQDWIISPTDAVHAYDIR